MKRTQIENRQKLSQFLNKKREAQKNLLFRKKREVEEKSASQKVIHQKYLLEKRRAKEKVLSIREKKREKIREALGEKRRSRELALSAEKEAKAVKLVVRKAAEEEKEKVLLEKRRLLLEKRKEEREKSNLKRAQNREKLQQFLVNKRAIRESLLFRKKREVEEKSASQKAIHQKYLLARKEAKEGALSIREKKREKLREALGEKRRERELALSVEKEVKAAKEKVLLEKRRLLLEKKKEDREKSNLKRAQNREKFHQFLFNKRAIRESLLFRKKRQVEEKSASQKAIHQKYLLARKEAKEKVVALREGKRKKLKAFLSQRKEKRVVPRRKRLSLKPVIVFFHLMQSKLCNYRKRLILLSSKCSRLIHQAVLRKKKVLKVVEKPAVKKRILLKKRKPLLPKRERKPFEIVPFLKHNAYLIFFLLLFVGFFGETAYFYRRTGLLIKETEEIRSRKVQRPAEVPKKLVFVPGAPVKISEIRIIGERDPFSSEIWRMGVVIERPKEIPPRRGIVRPIVKPEPEKIVKKREIPPLISEREKLSLLPKAKSPDVTPITFPRPTCPLVYRGTLEIGGIEYLFLEGKRNNRAVIGDIVEGYRIFDLKDGTIYLSKGGNIFTLSEKRLVSPLYYRGRLIMEGKEYFFLEGKRTYLVQMGESAEGYQLIKRIGKTIYLIKDDNIYSLKEEL